MIIINPLAHSVRSNVVFQRTICTSPMLALIQKWRKQNGLPMNPNSHGTLTDKADFSYLDGKPTPFGVGQKHRLIKQKEFLNQILQMSSEVDFAVERHKKFLKDEEERRRQILDSKLKPKGVMLLKK